MVLLIPQTFSTTTSTLTLEEVIKLSDFLVDTVFSGLVETVESTSELQLALIRLAVLWEGLHSLTTTLHEDGQDAVFTKIAEAVVHTRTIQETVATLPETSHSQSN